jgi:hypothetical protein
MAEELRADLSGGRRPGGHAQNYCALHERRLARLRLFTYEGNFWQFGVEGKRVIDGLVIQVAKWTVRFRDVLVGVPDGSRRRGEKQGEDRNRDHSPPG